MSRYQTPQALRRALEDRLLALVSQTTFRPSEYATSQCLWSDPPHFTGRVDSRSASRAL
jgi:hypothetical protein